MSIPDIESKVFVGREAELEQLKAALDDAFGGRGGLAMLVGKPGIGKTRLAERLANYAGARGSSVLWGRCFESKGSPPYWPWVQMIRQYLASREQADLIVEMGASAPAIAALEPMVNQKLPNLDPLPPMAPDQAEFRLFDSITTFLQNLSRSQPVLAVLDDLHWADEASLKLLQFVTRELADSRLMLICTYRDIELSRKHPLTDTLSDLSREHVFHRLVLEGLTVEDTRHLIEATAGDPVHRRVVESIYTRTEGNPLFLGEVVRLLSHTGQLTDPEPDDPIQIAVPEGVRETIGQRINRVTDRCANVLTTASIIGREFDFDLLFMLGDLSEDRMLDVIDEALEVHLIDDVPGTHDLYQFAHPLIHQTFTEELSNSRRARLHSRIARALEEMHSYDLEAHSAEFAYHFGFSSDHDELRKALDHAKAAADRATSVYAFAEAARLLEQALHILAVVEPDGDRRRCDLLIDLGEALLPTGEPLRFAESLAPEGLDLAEKRGDRGRAFRVCELALLDIRRYGYRHPLFDTWRQWVERADKYAEPGTRERAFADAIKSTIPLSESRLADARGLAYGSLELATRLGDASSMFEAAHAIRQASNAPQHKKARLQLAKPESTDGQGWTA